MCSQWQGVSNRVPDAGRTRGDAEHVSNGFDHARSGLQTQAFEGESTSSA
jgi:hypothetical protein